MFYNYEEFKKLINNMGSQNTKKIYVVIGNPIGHSISPFLHSIINKDCKYFALLLNSLQLQDFCAFAKNNLQGFNVTVPFKKEIIKYVDSIDDGAKNISSVNTVCVENGKLCGYNTDVYGLKQAFIVNGIEIKNKKALILGAGGSAASAVYVLKKGNADVTLAARNIAKAKTNFPDTKIIDITKAKGEYDLVVNCTPCGMKGQKNISAIDICQIKNCSFVYDLVYNPLKTKLITDAQNNGIKAVNGLDMLIYQGIKAQKIWGNAVTEDANLKNKLTAEIIKTIFQEKNKKGIALCGFMGCGKSSISKYLSDNYGFKIIDTDNIIETQTNQKISNIFSSFGEEYFRDIESSTICNITYEKGVTVLSLGGGAVLRTENINKIKQNCLLIYIDVTLENSLKRANDKTRPLLNKSSIEIQNLYSERKKCYNKICDVIIDGNYSIAKVSEKIINIITE